MTDPRSRSPPSSDRMPNVALAALPTRRVSRLGGAIVRPDLEPPAPEHARGRSGVIPTRASRTAEGHRRRKKSHHALRPRSPSTTARGGAPEAESDKVQDLTPGSNGGCSLLPLMALAPGLHSLPYRP